ncbi:MAG TPA: M20 family metallopeptidase [Dehalococcoidia bacterium]|nr:M20 family metallopeptidase [Dehalococcoidia bacterium]
MGDITQAKESAKAAVEAARQKLIDVSLQIHANPELAMKETKAAKLLAATMEDLGFAVERSAYGIETAVKGTWGEGPVTLAYLMEYDALPEIGHACGHNLIATAGLGGAIGLRGAVSPADVRLVVLGTPAEEDIGGKQMLIDKGAFQGVDAALMVHPAPLELADPYMFGVHSCYVKYTGREVHASMAPEAGINALDGLVTAYQAIAQLRQHIRRDARIAGVILNGGSASNVIPDKATGRFEVRALQPQYMEDLKQRVEACFEAGTQASGATVEVTWAQVVYEPMNNNPTLVSLYKANAEALGRTFFEAGATSTGSTDMGNVSWVVPSIHPTFTIGNFALNHTAAFTEVAATDAAHDNMIQIAQALAMTGVDLALNSDIVDQARAEFEPTRR